MGERLLREVGGLKEGTKTMLNATESDRETERVPISGLYGNPCRVSQPSLLKILVSLHTLTLPDSVSATRS